VTETFQTPVCELSTGATFAGRYQVIEELGHGGMGRVYKVFDKEIEAKIALKLIKPEVAADKNSIERFRNELKIARDISHKNICRMYDLGKEAGNYFITMEYVSGEDLKSFIRRSQQLVVGTAIFIAKQVCDGLAEAHRLGVVHRDLKPGNIMIDREGNAKIMDFGIARSISAKGITGAGVMIGTPEYMSPEQVEGKEVDQRSDLYSLGVIIYEMVTGRVPFEGDTPFTIAVKHKSEIPKDPKELNTQIPEDLSRLVLKCLEKDKEKRYQSDDELRADLEKIEKGIPTTERPISKRKTVTSKPITLTISRKKFFVPLSVLVAIAIIGIGLWRFLPKHPVAPPPSGKPSIAVLLFTDISPQKDQEYFCDGMTDEIISRLSRLEGWKVIPRTSVMGYRNSNKDIKLIGQELDVGNILEGSIRKEKDEIRISVRLLKVADLSSLWGDTYDRELKSIFEVQSDIAEKIAEVLEAKISPKVKEQFARKPTENLEAYNYYLRGLDYYCRYSKDDNENAILLFKKALELDPAYALAYAGLGNAYSQKALMSGFPMDWLDSAIEASNKAISIDPNLSEGFKALGLSYEARSWPQKARDSYERAVELNPNYCDALQGLGNVYSDTGEPAKALIVLKKALPIAAPAMLPNLYYGVGKAYLYLNELEKAVEWLNKCLEIQPGITLDRAHTRWVQAHLLKGEYQRARNQVQKVLSVDPNNLGGMQLAGMVEIWAGDYLKAKEYYQKALQASSVENTGLALFSSLCRISLGYISLKMGNKEEALRLFNEAEQETEKAMQQGDDYPSLRIEMAIIKSLQGKKSDAYEWLEQAIDMGWRWYAWSLKDPLLEYLHKDSQFQEMMTKVKAMVDEMRKSVEKEL
jgi:protein kinase/serine/threonine-protein kinase